MARKTAIWVGEDGRDSGKKYKLTEMPAAQSELWAARAFFAMAKGGIDVPDDIRETGMQGISRFALQLAGKIPFEDVKVLFDEMYQCIMIQPDPRNASFTRDLVDDDIEEISTRLKLRMAVMKLHTDFFDVASESTPAAPPAAT